VHDFDSVESPKQSLSGQEQRHERVCKLFLQELHPVHDQSSVQPVVLQMFLPPLQRPLSQASSLVQRSSSLQLVPVSFVTSQSLVSSLQRSSVQALSSSQSLSLSQVQT
jgi:hypothetical protein